MATNAMRSTVVGVFPDRSQAQQAVGELKRLGFREDQIGVIGREGLPNGKSARPAAEQAGHSKAAEGAATGVAAGAGVGALWALGIAAGMLPAIGPVIAGGLLASVLASAAGGAAIAGLVGSCRVRHSGRRGTVLRRRGQGRTHARDREGRGPR